MKNSRCILSCNHPCFDCADNQPDSCLSCYGGYNFNSQTKQCEADPSCNPCSFCPRGFALMNSTCVACQIDSSCSKCSPSDTTLCTQCKVGFFFNAQSVCVGCKTDCVDCLSRDFCFKCTDGHYMPRLFGIPIGICKLCDFGWATICD